MQRNVVAIPIVLGLLMACGAAHAATSEDFQKAFATAQAADKQAASYKNQWITTEQALAEAKKAAEAGNFDQAVTLAKEAEDLAKASVDQSRREENEWQKAVIR